MPYYVVVKVAESYDDERYSFEENGGGQPVHVFTNKAEADAVCARKQNAALAGCQIGAYTESWSDLTRDYNLGWNSPKKSYEEIVKELDFLNLPRDEDYNYEFEIPNGLTQEQYDKINNVFKGLRFYRVVEVP